MIVLTSTNLVRTTHSLFLTQSPTHFNYVLGAGDRRALHRAAGAGHMEITLYLLEKGAILDQADKR